MRELASQVAAVCCGVIAFLPFINPSINQLSQSKTSLMIAQVLFVQGHTIFFPQSEYLKESLGVTSEVVVM